MKKIIFDVTDKMFHKLENLIMRGDFMNRSEFLRFLIVNYFKEDTVGFCKKNHDEAGLDDDADDQEVFRYALCISPKELEEIKRKAAELSKNERQTQS